MKLISAQALKEKLDRGDNFKLVMTMGEAAYRQAHIPHSLWATVQDVTRIVQPDDEIVLYCSNTHCPASIGAYHLLMKHGYTNVRRFAGGLAEWEENGFPLTKEIHF
ncbi:MAG: rhodanese-like domain-containing protein [Anaerolineales bacterium]|nr:rhodanese-like domain-containing protein [Anaerolineales bacterium]